MRKHRKAQLEERMKLSGLWEDQDLVFTTRVGTPMSCADLITRSFNLSCGARTCQTYASTTCGIRATLLLSRGVHAKLVQELLGHSTIAVTLDTYSHVLPGMDDGLADTMDEALG